MLTEVIYTLKPPTLSDILGAVLKENMVSEDWYYQNLHTKQPLIVAIKGYVSYIAYAYGYSRRNIGPYIGSDNGSSVPYYAGKVKLWIQIYEADNYSMKVIVTELVRLESISVEIKYDSPRKIISPCPVVPSTNLKVYIKDIKGGSNWPLRHLYQAFEMPKDYVLVNIYDGFYQLVHKSDL